MIDFEVDDYYDQDEYTESRKLQQVWSLIEAA